MHRLQRRHATASAGFTLVELMVVIAIIAVLVAIVVLLGTNVVSAGKSRATADTIRSLEVILNDVVNEAGDTAPSVYVHEEGGKIYEFPIVDGRETDNRPGSSGLQFDKDASPATDTVALFLAASSSVASVESNLAGLDARLVRADRIEREKIEFNSRTVLDAWGRPIRMVHPRFDGGYGQYFDGNKMDVRRDNLLVDTSWDEKPASPGSVSAQINSRATFRRSYRPFDPASTTGTPVGDADEGICPGQLPYFYSSGPDEDPGTRTDNVYGGARPNFPTETRDLK